MKGITWGAYFLGGLSLVLTLFGFLTPPVAHADENSYIWQLEHNTSINAWGPKWMFLDLGHRVCDDLYAGWPTRDVINAVYSNPNFNFDYFAAEEVTYIARDYLC